MSYYTKSFTGLGRWFLLSTLLLVALGGTGYAQTQERGKYLPGLDNRLEIVVHIIGEVQRPGKYRVPDNTNLIELLSEAGGPTEFSNLSNVTVAHVESALPANGQNGVNHNQGQRLVKYNINKYLEVDENSTPPVLLPGDLIMVPSNRWRTWRYTATIIRDIAVVASAYFLYLRAVQK